MSPWVELIADEIHDRAQAHGPPFSALEIATALGYVVRIESDLGGPSGLLIHRTIVIAGTFCPTTIAMTIGHELGHAIDAEWRVFASEPSWLVEQWMDAIAIAVLAPRAAIAMAAMRRPSFAAILRLFYPLHPQAVFARLARLGLI